MRILGVDYGLARIGLALSDPTGQLAQGLTVLKRKSDIEAAHSVLQLVREHDVGQIVVGLPLNMNGSAGERARQCRVFAELLQEVCQLEVAMYDERLTTVAAERLLIEAQVRRKDRRQVVDSVAASILLQSYLDSLENARRREQERQTDRE